MLTLVIINEKCLTLNLSKEPNFVLLKIFPNFLLKILHSINASQFHW